MKPIRKITNDFNPEQYFLTEGLRQAVRTAMALDQPLLLTGEPGTGKTLLAYKVAHELAKDNSEYHFLPRPLRFDTKTTSSARDLFYAYDALGHFQAANIKREASTDRARTADFIELQALGLAIASTNPRVMDTTRFRTELPEAPRSSVVLIDEIDKAPRDFPNDILNEVENLEFFIKEENYPIKADNGQRILLVMTSNSEKNLPEAFLRRCVFHHIPFPDDDQLLRIVRSQLDGELGQAEVLLQDLVARFRMIRERAIRKPPATAELIAWLRLLEADGILHRAPEERAEQLKFNLSVLVKTREDLEAVRKLFGEGG